jgi:GNAT superfamily N-acetyltransferase
MIRTASETDLAEVRRLFAEYSAWVGLDLSFQDFDRELAQLPGDYVPPKGVLLVALVEGRVAGCVAAHQWQADTCEMKRLFVRDLFRGTGCGRALVAGILTWARQAGYRRILLDTLPAMDRAQGMYERLGFVDVLPYRPNPVRGVRFLGLSLD